MNETQSQEQNKEQACQQELAHVKERLGYLTADFDNFRRRTEKDRAQWMQSAQAAVLTDLIAIVDDFDRAFASGTEQLSGFELIHKSLVKLLIKYGIEEIRQLSTFDPLLHEAVMQVTAPDAQPGTIVTVFQKGYMLKGVVLRPATVSVAQ